MCSPMVAVQAGLAIGQAAVGYSAAKSDYEAKSAQYTQNVKNAQSAAIDEQKALTLRFLQEQERYVQDRHVSYLEQAQKSAEAEVSAAGAGVGGLSVDNILSDITGKSATNRAYMAINYRNTAADLTERLKATETTQAQRINSVSRPSSPSGIAFAIQAASGVTSAMK